MVLSTHRVVIVGGGTAGWLAACSLAAIGIPEAEFLRECDDALDCGHHLDAGEFAALLMRHATERSGVSRIAAEVTGVAPMANGDICALESRGHDVLEGDLFIDCSGQVGILIGGHYGIDWVDHSAVSLDDRPLAAPLPLEASAIVLIELSVRALTENFPETLPPQLAENLAFWPDQPLSSWERLHVDDMFPAASQQHVLNGMGFPPLPCEAGPSAEAIARCALSSSRPADRDYFIAAAAQAQSHESPRGFAKS